MQLVEFWPVARHFAGPTRRATVIQIITWFSAITAYLLYSSSASASTFGMKAMETATGLGMAILARQTDITYDYQALFGQSYAIDTALGYWNLGPTLQDFACCPDCSKLHCIVDGRFETHCTFKGMNGAKCGQELGETQDRKGGGVIHLPKRLFQYQSVTEWIGRTMSRPGLEDLMDRVQPQVPSGERIRDIWEGPYVRGLSWRGEPFWPMNQAGTRRNPEEARLLFGLALDTFNAHHSVAGKKRWSVGAIFLVCYNIPAHLRFRRENMCLLGIIPGPTDPSGLEFGHFLQPIVNDLQSLWTTGVWYTRTSLFPTGRLVRGALGPVVCDLAAARPVGGFTAFNAKRPCSRCLILMEDLARIIIYSFLTPRDPNTHRQLATNWVEATSRSRTDLEKENGVRWTVLLELEYWNPVDCLVVDLMHNGFLGNLRNHIRGVWAQDNEKRGSDGSVPIHRLPASAAALQRGRLLLQMGAGESGLSALEPGTLEDACWRLGLIGETGPKPSKSVMVEALLNNVSDIYALNLDRS